MIGITLVMWNPLISWWDYFIYGQEPREEDVEGESERDGHTKIKTVEVQKAIFLKRISDTLFTKSKKRDQKHILKIQNMLEETKISRNNCTDDQVTGNEKRSKKHVINMAKTYLAIPRTRHNPKSASCDKMQDFRKINTDNEILRNKLINTRKFALEHANSFEASMNRGFSNVLSENESKNPHQMQNMTKDQISKNIQLRNQQISEMKFESSNGVNG
jgi:hypothetical protein